MMAKQLLLELLWPDQYVEDFAVPWTVTHTRLRSARTPDRSSRSRPCAGVVMAS
jgi:hypothetical protein